MPGWVIGVVIAFVYQYILRSYLEWNPWDWLTNGWFSKIALTYFPALLCGLVAGMFGIFVTSKILRRANYEIVAYAASGIIIAVTILGMLADLTRYGINLETLWMVAGTLGIIIGLFSGYAGIKEEHAGRA